MTKSPSQPAIDPKPPKRLTGTYGQEDFSEAARKSKSETTKAGEEPKKGISRPNSPWPKA